MEIRMDMRADTYGHFCTNLLEVRAKDEKIEIERLAWGLHAIGDSADHTHCKTQGHDRKYSSGATFACVGTHHRQSFFGTNLSVILVRPHQNKSVSKRVSDHIGTLMHTVSGLGPTSCRTPSSAIFFF